MAPLVPQSMTLGLATAKMGKYQQDSAVMQDRFFVVIWGQCANCRCVTTTHVSLVVPAYRSLPVVTSACVLLENMVIFAKMVRLNPLCYYYHYKNFCRFRNYRTKFFFDGAWFVVLRSLSHTIRYLAKHGNPV